MGNKIKAKWMNLDPNFLVSKDGDTPSQLTLKTIPDPDYSGALNILDLTPFDLSKILIGTPDEPLALDNVIFKMTQEPTGFPTQELSGEPDRSTSYLQWNEGTLTLSILPTGTYFSFFVSGKKYESTGDPVQITNTEGKWYFYYDKYGVLNATQTYSDSLLFNKVIVAFGYRDATNSRWLFNGVLDERHGCKMDGYTHLILHKTMRQFDLGLGCYDFQINTGNVSSVVLRDSQFAVDSGAIWDEDLKHVLNVKPYTTSIPVYYKQGATGIWRQGTPVSGTCLQIAAGQRMAYNNVNAGGTGVWGLTEIPSNRNYGAVHIFATAGSGTTGQLGAVLGQSYYTTVPAVSAAQSELNNLILTGLPSEEMKFIATIIFQTDNRYTNSDSRSRVTDVSTGVHYVDWRYSVTTGVSGITVINHNDLINRDVAGNHSKIIPIGDTTTSFQITKADGLTSIFNINSTNNRIGVNNTSPTKSLDVTGNIKSTQGIFSKIKPSTDGTTNLQITKADGSTSIINIDSTNSRIGLGVTTSLGKLGIMSNGRGYPFIRMYDNETLTPVAEISHGGSGHANLMIYNINGNIPVIFGGAIPSSMENGLGVGFRKQQTDGTKTLPVVGTGIEQLLTTGMTYGTEVLTNGSLEDGTSWTYIGDATITTDLDDDVAIFQYSAGTTSYISQLASAFTTPMKTNTWYAFTFTITDATAGENGYASIVITHSNTLSTFMGYNRTSTIYFKTNSSTASFFRIQSTLTSGQSFKMNNLSLKEITSGGLFTGGGNNGIYVTQNGDIGVGTTSPSSCAILDLSSTTKGFLLPRMTTIQRNNISNPVAGLKVYDTDLNTEFVYNGSIWKQTSYL